MTSWYRANSLYRPLGPGQVRILCLLPDPIDAPIRCALIEETLEDIQGTYDALSYTWGVAGVDHAIDINGREVRVWKGLHEALGLLRAKRHGPYRLWADAISINQDDIEEKSIQISLMPEVYGYARTVQIYLGQATEYSAVGIEALDFIKGSSNGRDIIPISEWLKMNLGSDLGLMDILSRTWFERGWVVQECALARSVTVNVGPHSLSWNEKASLRFLKRVKFVEAHPLWREHFPKLDLANLREILEITVRRLSRSGVYDLRYGRDIDVSEDLLDVVHRMRHRKFTNDRDRIWSVQALAIDGRELKPDYNLTVDDTFEKLYEHTKQKHADKW